MPNDPTGDSSVDDIPQPIWLPDEQSIQSTHIAGAMKECGFDSFVAFYEWSVAQPAEFWEYVVGALDIRFDSPTRSILDVSRGPTSPDWLVGAKLNIAESCFSDATETCAVIEGSPDGSIRKFTHSQLRTLSNRVARGLKTHGCQQGDAVAVFLPMTAESVAIYLGIVLSGCTVVSIADSFSADELRSRLYISGAKAVFTVMSVRRGDRQLPVHERVVAADGPTAIVVNDPPNQSAAPDDLRPGDLGWLDLLSDDSSDIAVHSAPDEAMNILFSSGTTGEPKAIVWDHTTPIKAAADGFFHHDIHAGDIVAWPTNLGWMMGPWLIYATLINRGTIALFNGSPGDAAFGQFVQAASVNMLGVVPALVRIWRESGCLNGADWSAIKAFSSTGECSNPDDMRWLSNVAGGRPIIEYCGGTEIGGGYITSTLVQPNLPGMFSTPALGSGLVILDENAKPSDIGEVFLLPPTMGLSRQLINRDHDAVYYFDVPTDHDGRILRRHGDQMQRLSNGYYRALGRADDTMNLGGIKVGTAEIERVVSDTHGIREVAAVAVSSAEGGPSQLIIFAATDGRKSPSPDDLQRQMQTQIKSQLNPLFRIHRVVVVESLPRTASNKIMRRTLRDDWLQRGSEKQK
jgi:acetyl-CoA synthetase